MVEFMKILFGTVVFPASEPFMHEFMYSISKQKYSNFELLIINDGVDDVVVHNRLSHFTDLNIILIDNTDVLSPAELRVKLLVYAKDHGYDLLIIGDSDDLFSADRISCIADTYHKAYAAFYYNTLITDDGNPVFGPLPKELSDYREIGEYNFVGLSMIAINLGELSNGFLESLNEYKGEVFDWYFVSRMLMENKQGIFVPNAWTKYRIYEENYIGIAGYSEDSVEREIKIKCAQYFILSKYSDYYEGLYNAYISGDYVLDNRNNPKHYWWGLTRRNCNEI